MKKPRARIASPAVFILSGRAHGNMMCVTRKNVRVDDPLGDRRSDTDRDEGADEVEDRRDRNRHPRLERPRCNRRRHRIGRIVKPVGEVERQRRDDHEDQDEIRGPSSRNGAMAFFI